jgi:predicted dithiol-disulfide oxidoreductase (DUF899 family)
VDDRREEVHIQGPKGKASLLDLFEGRRQRIVYGAFFEPGVHGWPEQVCTSPISTRATPAFPVARLAGDIARLKKCMGWEQILAHDHDGFDADWRADFSGIR